MIRNMATGIRRFKNQQWQLSAAILILLLLSSIILNSILMERQATQTARFITRMLQMNDFREVSVTLQEARLEHFDVVRYVSAQKDKSFTLPPVAEFIPDNSKFATLTHSKIEIASLDSSGQPTKDRVEFEYNRFELCGYAALLWLFINLVSIPQARLMKKRLTEKLERESAIQLDLAVSKISRDVSHNIRTPLAALRKFAVIASALNKDERETLKSITGQIESLAQKIGVQKPSTSIDLRQDLYDCIHLAINEIRLAHSRVENIMLAIDDSTLSAITAFEADELRSILANLVNNAVEAGTRGREIHISVEDLADSVSIEVKDFGPGIEPEILPRVMEEGFTSKSTGTGRGLSHAKSKVESWGGKISIQSQRNFGTQVSILLTVTDRKSWYLPRIKVKSHEVLIVIDDQPIIHQIWRSRLNDEGFTGVVHYFYSIEEAQHTVTEALLAFNHNHIHVYVDHDLGENKMKGLEYLQTLPAEVDRCLVTGHFDEPEIKLGCEKHTIYLVSKNQLAELPLVVS